MSKSLSDMLCGIVALVVFFASNATAQELDLPVACKVDEMGGEHSNIAVDSRLMLFDLLGDYVGNATDFDAISNARLKALKEIAKYVGGKIQDGEPCQLIFVCTHNSRRSHMAQVWAEVAATTYGLDGMTTYSGGTEATALNIRTVNALRRAGFSVVDATGGDNPKYLIQYCDAIPPLQSFSKIYTHELNPTDAFAAVMCCGDADESCPNVVGAEARFSLHYDDPKLSDQSDLEMATYDERCLQIATEMFCVMSLVKQMLHEE